MSGKKQRISATVDPEIKERLDNLEETNTSHIISMLLREYLSHGESSDVALKLRKQELQQRRQNKEIERQTIDNEIDRLDDQIQEIEEKLKERRQAGLAGVDEFVERAENGEINPEYLHEDNPLIREQAAQAGVPPRRYAQEVQRRL